MNSGKNGLFPERGSGESPPFSAELFNSQEVIAKKRARVGKSNGEPYLIANNEIF